VELLGDEEADGREHGDPAVLDLDLPVVARTALCDVLSSHEPERIKEAKRTSARHGLCVPALAQGWRIMSGTQ
jgi:hypothetical protein